MNFLSVTASVVIPFGLLLGLIAQGQRSITLDLEYWRKLLHIVMGLVCLSFPFLSENKIAVIGVGGVFLFIFFLFRKRPDICPCWNNMFGGERKNLGGEFYFVLGVMAAFLISGNNIAHYCVALLVLTFADPAAAYCGERWGNWKIWGNEKTFEGSVAFFLVSCILIGFASLVFSGLDIELWHISLVFSGLDIELWHILVISLVASLGEALANKGADNLWIPILCLVLL